MLLLLLLPFVLLGLMPAQPLGLVLGLRLGLELGLELQLRLRLWPGADVPTCVPTRPN